MSSKNLLIRISILIAISFVSILIWYSPVIFKGYAYTLPSYKLVTARNMIETGKFSMENDKNVVLNTGKIESEGVISSQGDQLTTILSSFIYKIFGLPDTGKSVFIGVVIYSLALFFFSLTVWQLFDYKTAITFSIVYIFFPTVWQIALWPNNYEYGFFFLSLAFLLLFSNKFKNKYEWIKYAISGLLFALAFLSRDPIGLVAPALLIWLWLHKRKAIVPLFIALIFGFLIIQFSIQAIYHISNNNHFVYINAAGDEAQGQDFYFYNHLYPDPYTYHYEQKEFLSEKLSDANNLDIEAINTRKAISNVEPEKAPLWNHIVVAPNLLMKHIASLFIIENTGGPLMFLLFFFGLFILYKEKNEIGDFSVYWICSIFILSSFIFLVGRSHVMDFAFIYALLISIGILGLSKLVAEKFFAKNNKIKQDVVTVVVVLFVIYQQILISHIVFGRAYDNQTPRLINQLALIVNSQDITNEDIIAAPFRSDDIYALNYLTNKSYVKFDENTIRKLVNSGKLKEAFNDFHVTKILGFDKEITDLILNNSGVANISDNSVAVTEAQISPAKSLFMNLFR